MRFNLRRRDVGTAAGVGVLLILLHVAVISFVSLRTIAGWRTTSIPNAPSLWRHPGSQVTWSSIQSPGVSVVFREIPDTSYMCDPEHLLLDGSRPPQSPKLLDRIPEKSVPSWCSPFSSAPENLRWDAACGFPLPLVCLSGYATGSGSWDHGSLFGVHYQMWQQARWNLAPRRILWTNTLCTAIVAGGGGMALYLLPLAFVRRRRADHGHCAMCDYSIRALPRCPECGSACENCPP